MIDGLVDAIARERFRTEWDRNFAVTANAGSGKTTAISERLAAIALASDGATRLRRIAVVTYTKKAAAQIGERARQVLWRRLGGQERRDLAPLDHLEGAFFGTIHSFCLKLAQTHGHAVGVHLNPTVVAENDDALWEEFLEQDPMTFAALDPAGLAGLLRHLALEEIFPLARELDRTTADELRSPRESRLPPRPDDAAVEALLALPAKGAGAKNIRLSQERARQWRDAWTRGRGFLPLYTPVGSSREVVARAAAWMAPLKEWLAVAAASLAAELAERYRAWRFERGIQTYPDQIDAAMAVLGDGALLDRVRREGWRVILDEAQDTDPRQFAVLVEIARPPGAEPGAWPTPAGGVPGPRPGHFCLVGDGQQAIYGSRADVVNFSRHLNAFARGDSGELLRFQVTFRAPHAVIAALNATLPDAFGRERPYNFGLPVGGDGAPPPFLQVPYVPLEPGPANVSGELRRLPLVRPSEGPAGVDGWLAAEARQIASWLIRYGAAGVGARHWGEVAVLAPRNDWLLTAREVFEDAGLEVALQMRRYRSGDQPAHAWLAGLLAVVVDPENMFEWVGVLREVFAVSDGLIAAEIRKLGRFAWDEPSVHPEPLAGALAAVRPFVLRAHDAGQPLRTFADELGTACTLRDKLRRVDPSGGMETELDRLLAEAAELGLAGAGPRAWLDHLIRGIDDGRPAGKPSSRAISFLTAYSAKGLEWPVVIVLGLWRGIGKAPERGLRMIRSAGARPRVYFDPASLPAETREARARERMRELTRLLYVVLTRARHSLVLPWAPGFGVPPGGNPSFASLWEADLGSFPELSPPPEPGAPAPPPVAMPAKSEIVVHETEAGRQLPDLPARLLPHELAHHADLPRLARHESALDRPAPLAPPDDAVDYGLWWHEMLEFLPWSESDEAITARVKVAMATAESLGFRERAEAEWHRFAGSAAWRELRQPRWQRQAELAVFAPLRQDAWIDGVIDLVLHDPDAGEVWIVDWKTNRHRGGESDEALLGRLASDYAPQLSSYAACAAVFFPHAAIKAFIYSSAAGAWREVGRV